MPSINQQQLATLLNLSRATVSRSLSNHPMIHADTRAKVIALAEKLGYRKTPTRVIRKKRQSKPITIGVLVGMPLVNLGMATFPYVLSGIRQQGIRDHVAIDVVTQDPAELSPQNLRQPVFSHIRAGNWRGIILIYPFAQEVVRAIERKISVVSVLTEYEHLAIDTIDTDHSNIVDLIGRLSELGHERIGFVTWHYAVGGQWASRRFAAYAEGVFHHGLEFRREWTVNIHPKEKVCNEHSEIAEYVAGKIRNDGVNAWVCAADHQAYQLIADLKHLGINVPADCSVTGFDGIEPPIGMQRLTTLAVSHAEIGASALSRLLSRIVNPNSSGRKILVATELVEGGTVASPR